MAPNTSQVWNFFTLVVPEEGESYVTCNHCKQRFKTNKSQATSTFRRHLSKHPSELDKLLAAEKEIRDAAPPSAKRKRLFSDEEVSQSSQSSSSSQPTLSQVFERNSKYVWK